MSTTQPTPDIPAPKPAPLPGQQGRAVGALGQGWQVLDQGQVLRCTHVVTSVWFLVSSASPLTRTSWTAMAKAANSYASSVEPGQGGQVVLRPTTDWSRGRPKTTWSCRPLVGA